jgi:DNA replication protein DnaC
MKNPKHMLVLNGSSGLGKTHVCASMAEWALKRFSTIRVHNEENLLSRLRKGIRDDEGDYRELLRLMTDDDFVILNDVGSWHTPDKIDNRNLEWKREVLFAFLEDRYNSMKPTVITSNLSKEQFKTVYSERIASRLFASENTIVSIFDDSLDLRKQGL